MTCTCDRNKANYGAVYITGSEMPSIDELTERARSTLEWANGFYFNTEGADPFVRNYFSKNMIRIITEVSNKLRSTK